MWSSKLRSSDGVLECGKRRSSKARSDENLNALMRRICGVVVDFRVEVVKMRSRVMEMNGAMPLPPLTITSMSCLRKSVEIGP